MPRITTLHDLHASSQFRAQTASVAHALKDTSQQEQVLSALEKGFADSSADEEMRKDVEQLNRTVKDIRRGFNKINSQLVGFDEEHYTDVDGKVLELQPEWAKLLREFDKFLADSRNVASDAVGFMKSYVHVMMTEVEESDIPDLKKDLKPFRDKVEEKKQEAGENRKNFAELAGKVSTYKATISSAITKADTALKKKIEDAESRRDKLKEELESLETSMQSLLNAIGTSSKVAGTAALFAFVLLSPLAAIIAFGFALDVIAKANEYNKQKAEYDQKTRKYNDVINELNELNRKNDALKRFNQTIFETDEEITTLAHKIDTIANIWGVLASELSQFETDLDLAINAQSRRMFVRQIKVAKALYEKLIEIFDLYVKGAFVA